MPKTQNQSSRKKTKITKKKQNISSGNHEETVITVTKNTSLTPQWENLPTYNYNDIKEKKFFT